MICPNCREDNAPNFRFCGMCGTSLEPRRPVGAAALDPLTAFPPAAPPASSTRTANSSAQLRPVVVEDALRTADKTVPPIAGPSMLGLNQPAANPHSADRSTPHEPGLRQPSMDLLRERSFSGLDSFLEPEQPKTGAGRILLLLVLLIALGAAGRWTYTNYLGITEGRKPEPAASSAAANSAEQAATKPSTQDAAPPPAAGSSQARPRSGEVPPGPSENVGAGPDATRKTLDAGAKPANEAKPATSVPATPSKIRSDNREANRAPSATTSAVASVVTSTKISKTPAPAGTGTDTGDADFRKGEAYLYGRGGRENCDEAVRNLKTASAKSNAKARSAFGTMYATGHCVPRDLPTSYLWFALALRVDPNNQILEKDLTAVWNQMTPPERQMATRMKQ